jgi:hypothetical protein
MALSEFMSFISISGCIPSAVIPDQLDRFGGPKLPLRAKSVLTKSKDSTQAA